MFGGASRIVKVNRNLCGNCDSAASVSQLIKMSSTLEEQLKVKIEVQSEGEEVAVVKENLVEVGIIKVKIEPLEEQTVPVKQESMEIGFEPTSLSFESSLPVLTTVAPSPLVWRPYHCGLCSAQFGLAEEFRRHLKSHSDESVQQSDLSNESGTTSGVHSSNTCGICAVKFRSRRYLHRHIDRGTCGPFVCQPCRFVCSSRPEFVTHQQRHGSEIAAAFKCSFCQAVYMHKRNLLRHLDRGCARFRCRKCRIRLDDLADYHRHRERVHKIVMKGHCVTCGQRFESGAELTQHFQTCSKRG